ncbi:MAG: endonuclease III [Candidatus Paceibacterota bacterium]
MTQSLAEKQKRAQEIYRSLEKIVPDSGMILEYGNNFELLVSVMLSAQCTDVMVNRVTKKLFKKYRTLDDYINAPRYEFEQDIRMCGYYKQKAKRIQETSRIIKEKHGGVIPRTMDDMLELPGVARKTANVVLGNAYSVVEGIAVDTHVRRISQRLGLTQHTDPKKIESDLMKLFPKEQWFRLTYLMIEYGRRYSPARKKEGGILEEVYGKKKISK